MPAIASETVPKFAGHETFTLRYGWLKKAVDATRQRQDIFLQDDALVTLGVGKNMVRSIRHWGLVTGILEESDDVPNNRGRSIRPSALGDLLFGPRGLDPYLEEAGTLWLIHWQLAGIPDGPTTWFWVFNHLPDSEFTKEKLLADLVALAGQAGWKRVADNSLRRDIDCFLRTYVPARTSRTAVLEETLDCPLAELGLIQELEANHVYGFARGEHASLPLPVFAYALLALLGEDRRPAQRPDVRRSRLSARKPRPGLQTLRGGPVRVPGRHGDLHGRGDFLRRNRRAPATLPPRGLQCP